MTAPLKRVWRRKRRRLENQSREEESRSASNRAVGVAQNVMVSGYALLGALSRCIHEGSLDDKETHAQQVVNARRNIDA